MTKRLVRRYGYGHLHFITFSCYRRLPLLGSVRGRNAFAHILSDVRDHYRFSLVGYVVMPEHVHLLMSEREQGTPSIALQVLKQRTSRQLRGQQDAALPQFWQHRFYDFNVWSLKKKVEKLQYMHMNPLNRGLVDHPRDWPWSSYSFYSKNEQGLIRIDPVS